MNYPRKPDNQQKFITNSDLSSQKNLLKSTIKSTINLFKWCSNW